MGQRHMVSRNSMMVTRVENGITTSAIGRTAGAATGAFRTGVSAGGASTIGAGASISGLDVGFDRRRAAAAGAATFARPDKPRRWTLPITAFRVMF